ncbi:protein unc-45 homolog B [Condylostylus longicornis]|uniref:protein unc-45 homolog B n=1 Tax=Condylostylus longicornis TaxID=2530218 RepID=UPI00244DC023|nr:protein unc-45 homolog B [Condylostylus longicornis]
MGNIDAENMMEEATKFKEKGNEAFKNEKWDESIEMYSKAIKLRSSMKDKDLAIYYKNRAAAHLKKNNYEAALTDCTNSLEITPNDPKALFRRSQAYESLQKYEEAYKDAVDLWKADPNNKSVQPMLKKLHAIVQDRATENAKTSTKVKKMCEIAFDLNSPVDKRKSAMNNILVLAREPVGAECLEKEGIVPKIAALTKTEKCEEIYLNAIRTISEICNKNIPRTKVVIGSLGIPWFLQVLNSKNADRISAAQFCLQTILNTFSGMDHKVESKPNKEMCQKYFKEIDTILTCLVYSITDRLISGMSRDAIMELLSRNVQYSALNWGERLVEIRGLYRLMEVCSELEEYKYESAMDITENSRSVASVCLAKIYECMYYDELRAKFTEQIEEYVKEKLLEPDFESKVRVTVAITSLLNGPLDVGNSIMARDGVLQMILAMASDDDALQQKVACECIVAATSKKDKAQTMMHMAVDILKKLYNSKNEAIRVRALVGLCKLGSYGGTDASIRPFADGSTKKMAEACRRFLIKPGKDKDIRKWAADGLAYLTLDAEVKEKLCEDIPAIRALIELARNGGESILYGVVTCFVNLCNAYEKQELMPEMIELAKFAKHHIPEEHELDDMDFVNKRIDVLCNNGITSALVNLSKTDSKNSKELIARVFNAICSMQELRGKVVQDGGAKALLPMSLDGTEKGKRHASQALARIGITINPEVAFPGQRSLEVIRPLLNLLHPDCTALENFEALMALCNLAQMGESVRKRILTEQGLSKIEAYLMEDHEFLIRASVQCICNLCMSEEVVKLHEGENDRVKFLALLCESEDEETAKAASGALAMLTSESVICCKKIFDTVRWLDVLHTLIANPSPDVQHRGLVVILNMINANEEIARKVMETDVLELLMGLSKLQDEDRTKAVEISIQCLRSAERYNIIAQSNDAPIPDIFKEAERLAELNEFNEMD